MRTAVAVLLLTLAFAGCTADRDRFLDPVEGWEPRATLHTSLGDVTIELYREMVPLTVHRFMELAEAGDLDGTRFTRIVKGLDVQAGGPASVGREEPAPIWDEFHPGLRHDRAGVVSMATAGPDTGRGEFFITLRPEPAFDDVYSAFGHVVAGMDVVRAIEALPIEGDVAGPPLEDVTIEWVTLQDATGGHVRRGVAVQALDQDKATQVGTPATFVLVVTNKGTVRDTYTLRTTGPPGWTLAFESTQVAIPAGRSWAVLFNATPVRGAAEGQAFVVATSDQDGNVSAATGVSIRIGVPGPAPQAGSEVQADYTVTLEDGRIVDTTVPSLGLNPAYAKVASFQRGAYQAARIRMGDSGFPALEAALSGTPEGTTAAIRVPWSEAVAGPNVPQAAVGRNVVVEARVVAVHAS